MAETRETMMAMSSKPLGPEPRPLSLTPSPQPLDWGERSAIVARRVLGVRIDVTSYKEAVDRITDWALLGQSRYVCPTPVNNVITALDNRQFRNATNQADLVPADGMPLVWSLRLLGIPWATRVRGADLAVDLCRAAEELGIPVGFHGGEPVVLEALAAQMRRRFPRLEIAYAWSPPFRRLSREEEDDVARRVNASGTKVLFVGLGAPKQELWMASRRGSINAVMVGVGAAFDMLSGRRKQAPGWIQSIGMEWTFRLAQEPRRLWRRYLIGNPRFMLLFGQQFLKERSLRRMMRARPSSPEWSGRPWAVW